MRKALRNGWKRVCSVVLAAAMVITMLPVNAQAATSSSDNGDGTFSNPAVYADVPDIDIIRVEDAYYMVSTTMHLSPGCPIMKSTDLVNWEIVNYVYDILGDTDAMNLRNGENMYGNGQWAASLKYHGGTYYVAFNSNTTGTAYIYTTDDIERGAWTKTTLNGGFHDMSLFFDDNGKAYILYGGGQIKCAELSEDLKTVKKDTEMVLFDVTKEDWGEENIGTGLAGEGTHIMKKGEYYYVFNVCWPSGAGRTEICHRSKTFPSTEWENQVILKANFQNNGVSGGVAQGAVIDTADGKWYGFMFQDHGAIGRVPVLTDCTWKNDWPMLGKDGDGTTIEAVMPLPVVGSDGKSLVKSDEFYNDAEHRVFDAEQEAAATAKTYNAAGEDSGMETVELIENGDFENGKGTAGWAGFEGGEIEVVSADDGVNNGNVLRVKDRKNSSSSAMYDLTGKLDKAITYTITGKMKYVAGEDGPNEKGFTVRFQNRPTKQTPEYWNHRPAAGTIQLKKNEWKEFSISYTPADNVIGDKVYSFGTGENYFFIEASQYANNDTTTADPANHGMDYYLDDISITYERPVGGEIDDSLIQLFTNGDAERGTTEGWTTTPGENCKIEATNTEKAGGEYSIHVTERAGTGAGACQDISGKLVWGKTYTVSGKLKYTTGPDTKQFIVTIQNGPNYNYRVNVLKINAKKGEWVEFQGVYTPADKSDDFPFDPENNFIFIENGWTAEQDPVNDKMDYYLDDFSMTTTSDNMIRNGSFENGTKYWTGFEKATIAVTKDEHQEGSQSIAVTGRTACAQGPSQDLSNKLTPGNTYTLEAWVKYNTGAAEKKFNMTIQNGPNHEYRTVLGSATAKQGEWTKISAVWTMPEDAITNQNYLFFETPWTASPTPENDLMDFYVDNVSMIEKINDPKEPAESGEHDYNGSNLDLVWQWNHNPNNNNWSLTERNGWLRLRTGSKASSLLNARNTLTQRTFGPVCSGTVKMDISNMKAGDVAGLGSLSFKYGYIAVKKEADKAKLVMVDASGNNTETKEDKPVEKESVDCTANIVYLKEDFNYAGNADGTEKDTVTFYYSFDGKIWNKLGDTMKMSYELVHFMGSKFAIFNYATKTTGGYVDYDYFRVSDKITGAEQPTGTWNASMTATPEVSGVIGSECEVKLNLDKLDAGNYSNLKASLSIPDIMTVEDVTFNTAAIKGETGYTYGNGRLTITVKGDDVSFAATEENKLFAVIKLKMKGYADKDETVSVNADYIRVDSGAIEYNTENCSASIELKYLDTKTLAKKLGYGNPITTHEFGADPYAIEYNGRVYVYMTADDYQYDENGEVLSNDFGYITSLRVVSSADLMNWTDHGEIDVAGKNGGKGPALWASHAWAPAIAYKQVDGKDKFFLYFANDASGIGVLEADTPLGPWKDPIGAALLTKQTPGCQGVEWCFDPAVLVDDDGSAYIYFGGGVPNNGANGEQNNPKTARVAKLGADMISIEGEAKLIDAPCMFEDGGIFKYNDKYYYSYCSNFISPHKDGYPGYGSICYMVSDDPMGPFTYAGEIFSNPSVWFGVGGNNHHATFVYEGKSYFIYHAQTVSKALGVEKGYRSTHIDNIKLNSDGTIRDIKGTYAGISQLHEMNPYQRIDAETIAWNAGVKAKPCEETGALFEDYNMVLTDLQEGDWTSVSQLNFGTKGAEKFQVSAASAKGGRIEVRLDSPEGTLIGTAEVPATGSEDTYQLVTCDVDNVTGTKNVFLVFRGSETENIMNVDYYQFTEKAGGTVDPKPEKPTQQQIAELEGRITEAEGLLAKLSGTAKTKLEAAITAAQSVLNDPEVTADDVTSQISKMDAAIEAAEEAIADASKPVNEQLAKKIEAAKALLSKLTGTAKDDLQAAIEEAEAELKKPGATNEQLQEALNKLDTAVGNAEQVIEANKPTEQQIANMQNKINKAKELLDALTGTDKTNLQNAITAAENVLKKENLTKTELQEAFDTLSAAVETAEEVIETKKPLKEQLSHKIAEAEELLEKLNDSEREKLQTAIAAAKDILNKEGAADEEIQPVLNSLKEAVKAAEEYIEAEKQLNDKIAEAEKMLEKLGDAEKEKLQEAINAVKELLKTDGVTKEQLEEALRNLTNVVEESKPVKEQLNDKIAVAKKLLETLTADKKAKLEAVISEAEEILKKPDVTEGEIKAVLDKLKAAIVEAETPEQPPVQEEKPGLNQTFTEANGLTYKVTAYSAAAKNVTVTGTKKQLTSVTIPDTVVYRKETFKVTAIGDSAFANQKNLKSAVIGKHIVTIGKKAFLNDKKLVKITFKGTAVKTIGKDAFKNIGKKAAFTMNKTFTAKNLKYKISKCTASAKEVTVTGASKKLTSINVPATVKFNGMVFKVTAVNKKAFRKQTKLKSVVIGKNVKTIGNEAFSGAKKLAKIKFSGTALKSIGKNAFKNIKKNAVFSVKKSKRAYYKKLLKKAKTKNYKVK